MDHWYFSLSDQCFMIIVAPFYYRATQLC